MGYNTQGDKKNTWFNWQKSTPSEEAAGFFGGRYTNPSSSFEMLSGFTVPRKVERSKSERVEGGFELGTVGGTTFDLNSAF